MNRSPVFADASAWLSIANPKDAEHDAAVKIYARLNDERRLLIVTNWVAYEAISWLKGRRGWSAAQALRTVLEDRRRVRLVRVTPRIESLGLGLFWRTRDKSWGVVDCTSLITMSLTGCGEAFGFDRHFIEAARQFGFTVLSR